MLQILSKLLEPKSNCPEVTCLLVKLLNVKISKTTIIKELKEHPNYPSLLSISDVLSNYGIENLTASVNASKLPKVPMPFITQVKSEEFPGEFFTVVKKSVNNNIEFLDPVNGRWKIISQEDFSRRSSGIVLLTETQEGAGEKKYKERRIEERRKNIFQITSLVWLPTLAIIASIIGLFQVGITGILSTAFLALIIIGCVLGVLLVYYELDQYNPVLKQICSSSKKINCGAILQSKASKIGGVSWSIIGLSYFVGTLLLFLFWGVNNHKTLFVVSWLNVIAIPYVFFSVYYQFQIAKQWCVLCLSAQAVLILQLLVALGGNWYALTPDTVTTELVIQMILAISLPFLVANILVYAFRRSKQMDHFNNELQRLKHDPKIFEALLTKQKEVEIETDGLGILLGARNAEYKILKVCNPYCGPCARAHAPIESLLQNNSNLQVQILFNVTDQDEDYRNKPAKHLLAINGQKDQTLIKKALEDWYLSDAKTYEDFATQYPMNDELDEQGSKIEAMHAWCRKMDISFTPTFFVSIPLSNGEQAKYYQLPGMYNVNDLKYFLSV